MKLTVNFCKATGEKATTKGHGLLKLAKKGKLWHGESYFWLKASASSEKNHAFYFRHAVTKKRSVLKDEHGKAIRPQNLTSLGGTMTLAEIEALATSRATGAAPVKRDSQMTLAAVLDQFFTMKSKNKAAVSEASERDMRHDVTLYGYDWMTKPVTDITSHVFGQRAMEIASGKYKNPLFDMTPEDREIICDDLGMGKPSKKFCGTPKSAEKFCRYLRTVLTKGLTAERAFVPGEDPVTMSEAMKKIDQTFDLEVKRKALPLLEHEIAKFFNFNRSECVEKKNGFSKAFDPIVWRAVLTSRFAILTGYRVGDIANLREGNDFGDELRKKKGECVKRPLASHVLPVTTQMRDILAECKAMRDSDEKTLKQYGWTKLQINTLLAIPPKRSEMIFPILKTGKQQKQASQNLRPAFQRFDFPKAPRQIDASTWVDEDTAPKPHDTRATFATFAHAICAKESTVSSLMNHANKNGGIDSASVMTMQYVGVMKETLDQRVEEMQKISDAVEALARDVRKSKLTVVK